MGSPGTIALSNLFILEKIQSLGTSALSTLFQFWRIKIPSIEGCPGL